MSETLQILYHGNCLDGVLSAAILSRFFLDGPHRGARMSFRAMAHSSTDPFGADHEATLWADINAVVDFRYSPSPRLTWWCDHHATAFLRPGDRDHFEADTTGRKHFDPAAPSCAGLLRRWLVERHGLDARLFADHVRWADLIDGARFESPEQAVELREPALQLMALLEAAPGEDLVDELISLLAQGDLEGAHRSVRIQRALEPVLQEHRRAIALFKDRLQVERGVATFDLTEDAIEGFNKFIPYYLNPDIRYTVGLTCSPRRAKVSLGSNPWNRPQPLVDLGALCQRYGGGGHAVVGAITLPCAALPEARRAFQEVVEVLRGGQVR
jgi:hypothetical protein